MPIWQLCANLLIPNCLRSNLSYSPLAALEFYVNKYHSVISKLKQIKKWTRGEKNQLQEIAKTNNQVSYIIDDDDVADFYKSISAD